MSYVATDPRSYVGKVVGNGHCVALVQQAATAPHTSQWRAGAAVLGASPPIKPGVCVATFDPDGTYGNHTDGRSHAAVFLRHSDAGMHVLDQWQGHPCSTRIIRDKQGAGPAVDDSSRYAVIE